MALVYVTANCPACDAEIEDIEGEVFFCRQGHPYGSTTAYEQVDEVDVPGEIVCPECGYTFNGAEYDRVREHLHEHALELAADGDFG